jgi:hypothetical protein
MDKPSSSGRYSRASGRRMAWWIAFAALAGFLLAEAT